MKSQLVTASPRRARDAHQLQAPQEVHDHVLRKDGWPVACDITPISLGLWQYL